MQGQDSVSVVIMPHDNVIIACTYLLHTYVINYTQLFRSLCLALCINNK